MKKILSAIAIMALMIVFASCTNSRKDGGASLYEPDNGMILIVMESSLGMNHFMKNIV